jgi:hypothetical protein
MFPSGPSVFISVHLWLISRPNPQITQITQIPALGFGVWDLGFPRSGAIAAARGALLLDILASLRYQLSVPVIARFHGITVEMCFREHGVWQTQEYKLLPGLD